MPFIATLGIFFPFSSSQILIYESTILFPEKNKSIQCDFSFPIPLEPETGLAWCGDLANRED